MGKWVHRLSEIDPENRTAVCAECGPVKILRKSTYWRCGTHHKIMNKPHRAAYRKAYRESHPRSKHRVIVTKDSVCDRCGFLPEHPEQLDVHRHRDPDPEILCANCHRIITRLERLRTTKKPPE